MSILGTIKEALKAWNNWDEDKEGRLRREIKALEEKVKKIQHGPPNKGNVKKILKLKKQINKKKNYLIQGAK